MCTAITYKTNDFYFGRTLDYETSYCETVTITPRRYPLSFRHLPTISRHFAIMGMAYVCDNYPLYYDAINEVGLGMAGLNFVGNAHFNPTIDNPDNVATFEFIPYILSQCKTVSDAEKLIDTINLTNTAFNSSLPPAPLHWIIADRDTAITVEATADGIKVYNNPVGVLTNNPPFPEQMRNLTHYMHLSPKPPENKLAPEIELIPYSRGMGAMGLPGDLSSQSRFVRATFTKLNSVSGTDEAESVGQFFHILNTVSQTRGCCEVETGGYEITIYTSCCNATRGIYYYTTYNNHQITAIDMHRENPDGDTLISYPLKDKENINYQQ